MKITLTHEEIQAAVATYVSELGQMIAPGDVSLIDGADILTGIEAVCEYAPTTEKPIRQKRKAKGVKSLAGKLDQGPNSATASH